MRMFGSLSPVVVCCNRPVVFGTNFRIGKTLAVVADGQDQLVGDEAFFNELQSNAIGHLLCHHSRFLEVVGTLQHLSVAQRICFGPIGFHGFHRAGFPAPGMVDEQFGIDAKEVVEEFFVAKRTAGNLSHRVDAVRFQFLRNTFAHTPKAGEWTVVPKQSAIAHFVKLCDAHSVLVGRDVLGYDVHGNLAQIHIGANAGCCGDSCGLEHVGNHLASQFMSGHLV